MKSITVILTLLIASSAFADTAEKLLDVQKSIHNKKSSFYSEKEKWDSEKGTVSYRTESLRKAVESRKAYYASLKRVNLKLKDEITQKKAKVESGSNIERRLSFLLAGFLVQLRGYIEENPGYSKQERLAKLNQLMDEIASPDMQGDEKIRRTMEAHMVESDLARFSEVYEDKIELGGEQVSGYVVRIGGLAQFFVTPDASLSAVYSRELKAFLKLPDDQSRELIKAASVINKTSMPDIVSLPVGRISK